jgi:hypothetical protein
MTTTEIPLTPNLISRGIEAIIIDEDGKQKILTTKFKDGSGFKCNIDESEDYYSMIKNVGEANGYTNAILIMIADRLESYLDPKNLMEMETPDHQLTIKDREEALRKDPKKGDKHYLTPQEEETAEIIGFVPEGYGNQQAFVKSKIPELVSISQYLNQPSQDKFVGGIARNRKIKRFATRAWTHCNACLKNRYVKEFYPPVTLEYARLNVIEFERCKEPSGDESCFEEQLEFIADTIIGCDFEIWDDEYQICIMVIGIPGVNIKEEDKVAVKGTLEINDKTSEMTLKCSGLINLSALNEGASNKTMTKTQKERKIRRLLTEKAEKETNKIIILIEELKRIWAENLDIRDHPMLKTNDKGELLLYDRDNPELVKFKKMLTKVQEGYYFENLGGKPSKFKLYSEPRVKPVNIGNGEELNAEELTFDKTMPTLDTKEAADIPA